MRTHVSFQLAAPCSTQSLFERLRAGLLRRGISVQADAPLDYAIEFELGAGERVFHAMLGAVNDGVREWLVFAESTVGRIARWRGVDDREAHVAVLAVLHDTLGEIGAREVRWYEADDWNNAPDERWASAPGVS